MKMDLELISNTPRQITQEVKPRILFDLPPKVGQTTGYLHFELKHLLVLM